MLDAKFWDDPFWPLLLPLSLGEEVGEDYE